MKIYVPVLIVLGSRMQLKRKITQIVSLKTIQ